MNLAYHFTNDIMGYVMYSEGFKAGGFNAAQSFTVTSGQVPNDYPSEKAYDFEGGIKSQLFDKRVTLNVTGFYTIKDNSQLFQFIPSGALNAVTILNRTDSEGFEAEVNWQVTRALLLATSLGYTHSTIGSDHTDGSLVGNRSPYVPDLSATVSATYTREIVRGIDMTTNVTYNHWGSEYFTATNTPWTKRNALDFLDARVAFDLGKTGLELGFWAKNLTNVRYNSDVISLFDTPSTLTEVVYLAPPRTYGADLTYRF